MKVLTPQTRDYCILKTAELTCQKGYCFTGCQVAADLQQVEDPANGQLP